MVFVCLLWLEWMALFRIIISEVTKEFPLPTGFFFFKLFAIAT